MDLQLTSKVALVTGSTKGIGFAIAVALAREGARVIVNGRSQKSVDEALQRIREIAPSARIDGFAGDLSTAEAASVLLKQVPAVDILVNNLGIFEPKPFEDISDDEWRRFFEVNVLSAVRLSREYLLRDARAGLGTHRLSEQRKRHPDSAGDDSLRHDEDCVACRVAGDR